MDRNMRALHNSIRSKILIITTIVVGSWFWTAHVSSAAYYFFPEYESYEEIQVLEDPTIRQYHYGVLQSFPHTYEFSLDASTTIAVSLWVPELSLPVTNLNAIVVKKLRNGSVEEVYRLNAPDASWQVKHDRWGTDSYLVGPAYEGELPTGTYLLEVNSPTNVGKYVLVVGDTSSNSFGDMWRKMVSTYSTKRFHEKKVWSVLTAPVIFVPFGVTVLAGLGLLQVHRRRRTRMVDRRDDDE